MQVSLVDNANVRNISSAFSISGSSLTLKPINPKDTKLLGHDSIVDSLNHFYDSHSNKGDSCLVPECICLFYIILRFVALIFVCGF